MPHAGICLVDHQQVSQLNKSIDVSEEVFTIKKHSASLLLLSHYLTILVLFYAVGGPHSRRD